MRRASYGPTSDESSGLFYLALDLDPDPTRVRLRQAIIESDSKTLLDLFEPQNIEGLPAASCWVLGKTLWSLSEAHRPAVFRGITRAAEIYPTDFVLQFTCGRTREGGGQLALAVSHYMAAKALRPKSVITRVQLSSALYFTGQLEQSREQARIAVALDPNDAGAQYELGTAHQVFGDLDAGYECLKRSVELSPAVGRRAELMVASYHIGRTTKAEILTALEVASDMDEVRALASGLITHPDPEQRDPALVLENVDDLERVSPGYSKSMRVAKALAYLELGDPQAAQVEISENHGTGQYLILSPLAIGFLRATIHAGAGDRERALEWYGNFEDRWGELTRNSEAAWSRTDVAHWRSRARAELGL